MSNVDIELARLTVQVLDSLKIPNGLWREGWNPPSTDKGKLKDYGIRFQQLYRLLSLEVEAEKEE